MPRVKLLGSYPVDGPVWNQPLIAQNIGGKDLLIVCTMRNSCYAFDAKNVSAMPVWSTVNIAPAMTTYPANDNDQVLYGEPLGCLSTPVTDLFHRVLYVVCGDTIPSWTLYKLDLKTGAILNKVAVAGSVVGTGDGSISGQVAFDPANSTSRPALTLANGNVYLGFGSYGDDHPWHGWIFAYDASSLTQKAVFNTTPNGYGGSIWFSGGGFAVDGQGNLYAPTGNGSYDGVSNFGNSVIKLSPTLQLLGSYTPANWSQLETQDWDLTSGRPALIPSTNLLVFGAKDSNLYSLDTTCMCSVQIISVTTQCSGLNDPNCGVFGGSVVGNGTLYMNAHPGGVFSYQLSGTSWSLAAQTPAFGFPGAALTYTSNSGSNTLLWGITASADAETIAQQGTLRVWDPVTLAELWNSGTFGTAVKYANPTVANGFVYISTVDRGVLVYGLPSIVMSLGAGGNMAIGGSAALQ